MTKTDFMTWEEFEAIEDKDYQQAKWICRANKRPGIPEGALCGRQSGEEYSLGVYAGKFCDECWKHSGYRKGGREDFDEMDAGESY